MNDQATDTGQAAPFRTPADKRIIELDFDQFENREDIVLDPKKPKQAAEALVSTLFTNSESIRTLHRYRGSFWRYDGSCYREAEKEDVEAAIWHFLSKARKTTQGKKDDLVDFDPNKARVADTLSALSAVCLTESHIEPPVWLGDDRNDVPAKEIMAVGNGLLHLPTRELYSATPSYFNLSASEVAYDGNAAKPEAWIKFLGDLFEDDFQAMEALQEFVGYCLSTDTEQQKILLVTGPTRSGKGTIARVITALLGRNSVTNPTLAGLAQNFGLQALIGKPVGIISDARLSGKTDFAVVAERLLSISGEDSLTIDRKFKEPWTGRLPTRFIVMTNELPALADASGALAGRFLVATLKKSFYGREDHGLTNRLLEELPGILNWALDGYDVLRERGHFIQPFSSQDAIEELEALASPIKAFIKEECDVGPGHSVDVNLLFSEWKIWCENNNRREAGTKQMFGRNLGAAVPGIRVTQPREEGRRLRVYEGIGLRRGKL